MGLVILLDSYYMSGQKKKKKMHYIFMVNKLHMRIGCCEIHSK